MGLAPILQGVQRMFGSGPSEDRTEVKAERKSSDGEQSSDASSPVTKKQQVTALPRPRSFGTDLTWPLLFLIVAGALALATRTAVRASHPD